MRSLILLRHGKAVREHEAPNDRARSLTDRGRREATEAGTQIAAARLAPELALISSAARTRETAACALAILGAVESRLEDGLYMATPEQVFAAFAATTQGAVLIVGHNPGLSDLVAMLIDQDNDGSRLARDLREGLSTASFAAFEIGGDVIEAAAPRLIAGWRP
jgi:phosphohistidine phosphatase